MLWPAMSPTLDFYFFIGSTYSHLSVWRAAALAHERGVELVWRPFSVRTLMREQQNPPFVGKPVKMRYMWRDVERRARRFGVPFAGEPPYPIDRDERANHLAMRAALDGWCPEFARAAYHACSSNTATRGTRPRCGPSSRRPATTPTPNWRLRAWPSA